MSGKGRGRTRVALGTLVLTVVAVIVIVIAASSGGNSSKDNKKAASGGDTVFRMGAFGPAPPSLNPFAPKTSPSYTLFNAIYPTLYTTSVDHPDSGNVPELAVRETFSEKDKTITYFLRPGAKWSDGHPMTAADVVFTCNLALKYQDDATSTIVFPLKLVAKGVSKCESPSPDTVVMHVTADKFNANTDHILHIFYILPKHVWEPRVGADAKGLKTFNVKPGEVTGGPYTVSDFKPQAGQILLKRNPHYKGDIMPKVEYNLWTSYTDAQAMASDLKARRLDVAYALPPNIALSLKGDPNVETLNGPTGKILELLPNAWAKYKKHPELRERSVRQAISDAIDRKAILESVYRGYGNITTSPLTPTQYDTANPSTLENTYDVAKANAALDAAGFKMGPDGVRVANGRAMDYKLLLNTSEYGYNRIGEILKKNLAEIGIRVTVELLDDTAFQTTTAGPKYEFDMAVMSQQTLPDPSGMYIGALCVQHGIFNYTGYCDEEFDKQYDRWKTDDEAGMKDSLLRQSEMFAKDLPSIPLAMQSDLGAVAKGWSVATATDYQQALSKLFVTLPQQAATN